MGNRPQEFSDTLRSKHPVLGQMSLVLQSKGEGGGGGESLLGLNMRRKILYYCLVFQFLM